MSQPSGRAPRKRASHALSRCTHSKTARAFRNPQDNPTSHKLRMAKIACKYGGNGARRTHLSAQHVAIGFVAGGRLCFGWQWPVLPDHRRGGIHRIASGRTIAPRRTSASASWMTFPPVAKRISQNSSDATDFEVRSATRPRTRTTVAIAVSAMRCGVSSCGSGGRAACRQRTGPDHSHDDPRHRSRARRRPSLRPAGPDHQLV